MIYFPGSASCAIDILNGTGPIENDDRLCLLGLNSIEIQDWLCSGTKFSTLGEIPVFETSCAPMSIVSPLVSTRGSDDESEKSEGGTSIQLVMSMILLLSL